MSKLTKRNIDALKPGERRDTYLWDGELRGLGARVKSSGTKTFISQSRN